MAEKVTMLWKTLRNISDDAIWFLFFEKLNTLSIKHSSKMLI
jgi:hypothetical protein